jgi:HSP20 family protein
VLTIRARRTVEHRDRSSWLAAERPQGTYLRRFSVGEGIDSERIAATYDNGVLSLVIPVSEKAKPRKIQLTVKEPAAQRTLASH